MATTIVLVGADNVVVVVAVVVVEVDWLAVVLNVEVEPVTELELLAVELVDLDAAAVEIEVPVDAEAVEVAEVVDDWDVVLEAVVETTDVDTSDEVTVETEVDVADSVVREDVDDVATIAVDEELRVELSIGKIVTAFAVDQLEMSIRATIEIRTPTENRFEVNADNILLLGAGLNRHTNATTLRS